MDNENQSAKIPSEGIMKKVFNSKKNWVAMVHFPEGIYPHHTVVMKRFTHPENAVREAGVLSRLQGKAAVPRVFACRGTELILEYVPGLTLAEWLEIQEKNYPDTIPPVVDQMLMRLLDWLSCFYAALSEDAGATVVMGDVNLRNFIVGDTLTGIDFEDSAQGNIQEDLGKIAAFILMYRPEKTRWKSALVDHWLAVSSQKFGIPRERIQQEMDAEMERMALRRPKKQG